MINKIEILQKRARRLHTGLKNVSRILFEVSGSGHELE